MIKKTSVTFQLFYMFVLFSFLMQSCVRERDTDTNAASDLAMHAFIYQDAANIADDAATKNTGENLSNYKTRGYCATLTHDKLSNPRTMIIDFGSVNCMGNDGRERRGSILVSYTGNYNDSGSVHTITFDEYFVNDHQFMGQNIIENKGKNGASNTFYTSKVDAKVLKPLLADTLYFQGEYTIVWKQGESTPIWGDDVYEIIGKGSGRNEQKTFYAMNITEPLIKDVLNCRYFHTGKVAIQPQGKALRTLDFGDGDCDNDATVTINNKVFHIELW